MSVVIGQRNDLSFGFTMLKLKLLNLGLPPHSQCFFELSIKGLSCFPGITPDGIVGHSVGELGCAYADGSFTAKEVILAAYWRGMS